MGLRATLDKCFTQEDREELFRVLVVAALSNPLGNVEVVKLLLGYTYGKPVERKEITGGDGEPLLQPIADALDKVYGDRKKNL